MSIYYSNLDICSGVVVLNVVVVEKDPIYVTAVSTSGRNTWLSAVVTGILDRSTTLTYLGHAKVLLTWYT